LGGVSHSPLCCPVPGAPLGCRPQLVTSSAASTLCFSGARRVF
jgi:hypothetical protein